MKHLALVGLAACGSVWPDIPGDGTSFPEATIVGHQIAEGSIFRGMDFGARFASDALYVLVHENAGSTEDGDGTVPEGVRVFAVSAGGDAHELPALPAPGGAFLGTRLDDTGCIVATDGGVSLLDGGAWRTIPLPDGVSDVATDVMQVIARDASAVALVTADGQLFAWSGAAWSAPVMRPNLRIGAADATGLRAVYVGSETIETAAFTWALAPIGATASVPAAGPAASVQPNGTIDDFYFVGNELVLDWFTGGTINQVGLFGSFIAQAPGHHRIAVLETAPVTDLPAADLVENGASLGPAFPAASAHIPCGCDVSTDATCECLAHTVTFLPAISADASRVGLVTASDLNARRLVYANQLALPLAAWP